MVSLEYMKLFFLSLNLNFVVLRENIFSQLILSSTVISSSNEETDFFAPNKKLRNTTKIKHEHVPKTKFLNDQA